MNNEYYYNFLTFVFASMLAITIYKTVNKINTSFLMGKSELINVLTPIYVVFLIISIFLGITSIIIDIILCFKINKIKENFPKEKNYIEL